MRFIKEYAWTWWIGAAFYFAGWSVFTWQFYAATIPLIFLVVWSEDR